MSRVKGDLLMPRKFSNGTLLPQHNNALKFLRHLESTLYRPRGEKLLLIPLSVFLRQKREEMYDSQMSGRRTRERERRVWRNRIKGWHKDFVLPEENKRELMFWTHITIFACILSFFVPSSSSSSYSLSSFPTLPTPSLPFKIVP